MSKVTVRKSRQHELQKDFDQITCVLVSDVHGREMPRFTDWPRQTYACALMARAAKRKIQPRLRRRSVESVVFTFSSGVNCLILMCVPTAIFGLLRMKRGVWIRRFVSENFLAFLIDPGEVTCDG